MNNIYINCLKTEKLISGEYYGEFLIDSLSQGQGISIGNLLRRVLLGDLGGKAISAVRIVGIQHEFSAIPGVREDVLELLLNLKGIIFKFDNNNTEFGSLKVKGPMVITADLINLPSNLEIVNKNHYLATITTPTILEIEFKIEYGTGYKLVSQPFSEEESNFLQLDSIFMPVQKVNFKIENVHDLNNKITERLFFQIWTNGSLLPFDAIKMSCKIVVDLFLALMENENLAKTEEIKSAKQLSTLESYLETSIEELQLSVRSYNCLKKAQINTVGDLLKYSPKKLKEIKNFGKKSANEVFSILKNRFGIIYKSKSKT